MRIRIVPTASGNYAVQVVSKRYGKLTVHKHIGTFRTDYEKHDLWQKAYDFIQQASGQENIFDRLSSVKPEHLAISQNRPLFVYRLLSSVYEKLGFDACADPVIKDLILARIYSPDSKQAMRNILEEDFGKTLSLKTIYRHLKKSLEKGVKENFQKALIQFAKEDLKDGLRLVFYDVTTLYFESNLKTTLKDVGFSKDHRPQDTQVIIGLVVNRLGFPLYFDVFSGKTFEGHTFISVVEHIQILLENPELVVVADSAMLSQNNIDQLEEKQIGFIVGARMANLPRRLIDAIINQLNKQDGKITTVIYSDQRLVCQYLHKRALKDRADREKQIERAKKAMNTPSRKVHRYRFLKTKGSVSLNKELIAKAEQLEGIKGYITNTKLPEILVIERYHDLWRIEGAFRLTKSDLEARPIFHRLDETIKAHVLVVFAGLAVSRYLEIQTGTSLKQILKAAGRVLTHKVTNTKTGETAFIETTIEDPKLKEKIDLLKSLGH